MTDNTSDAVVLSDRDGNYYAFDAEQFAAVLSPDEDGEYYAISPDELAAARVPDDAVPAVEDAVGIGEVAGFGLGDPIPEVDVKLGKNPGGSFSLMGSFASVGTPIRPGGCEGARPGAPGGMR